MWLPSGGSLVIDTTEAMTVIDVNTGKFTGQGGNLEQTVTRNNLEAAEEIVRQLRLRDVGGIIVIDFIDMVLESNRDLVLRRLIECLARDRTKHQVAEVTSLGLVQMTRKRVGSGLLAAFSVPCEHCNGRGVLISTDLTEIPHAHGRNGQHALDAEARPVAVQVGQDQGDRPGRAGPWSRTPAAEDDRGRAARSGRARGRRRAGQVGFGQVRERRVVVRPEFVGSVQAIGPVARSGARIQTAAQLRRRIPGPTVRPRMRRPRSRPRPARTRPVPSRRTARRKRAVTGSLQVSRPATESVADQPSAGPAQAASADTEQAAAPRKRTRRSAYREAGPPDSVLASTPAPSGRTGPGGRTGSGGRADPGVCRTGPGGQRERGRSAEPVASAESEVSATGRRLGIRAGARG